MATPDEKQAAKRQERIDAFRKARRERFGLTEEEDLALEAKWSSPIGLSVVSEEEAIRTATAWKRYQESRWDPHVGFEVGILTQEQMEAELEKQQLERVGGAYTG